jgi:hypothetical protein
MAQEPAGSQTSVDRPPCLGNLVIVNEPSCRVIGGGAAEKPYGGLAVEKNLFKEVFKLYLFEGNLFILQARIPSFRCLAKPENAFQRISILHKVELCVKDELFGQ